MASVERFTIKDKQVTLHLANSPDAPLIVWNDFDGDGTELMQEAEKLQKAADLQESEKHVDSDFNLLSISNVDWNHDMAPWECGPQFPGDKEYTGGADDHLGLILDEIMPRSLTLVSGTPRFKGIAGYSLAGLFALYAMYRCDGFDRAASMSGSLWYPGFREYVMTHDMKKAPDKLYLSLGDKEARTRHPLMKTVQENTEAVVEHYRDEGLDVTWELNPGNHFRDPMQRSAKGILAIL